MTDGEEGFRVVDKRAFQGNNASANEEDCGPDPTEGQGRPLPEMDFGTFVLSLASSALMHLGELPNAETGHRERNLPLARQTIDILGVLQEKTKGNLTQEEDRLLTELLYDLRLKYVAACQEGRGE